MRAQNVRDRKSVAALVLDDAEHPMARVAGLCYFIENYLHPNMPNLEPEIVEKLKRLAANEDVDLKALALMSLHFSQDQVAEVHEFLIDRLQLLDEEETLVRNRWSIALAYLAARFRDRGDAANAIVTFRRALAIKPDDATTLLHLGMTYSNAGDLESAMTCYQQAANLAPDNAMIFVNWGIALRQKGDTNSAIEKYQKALAINPHLALAHFNLGNVYYGGGDFMQAIPAYEKAVELDPSFAVGHFFLARAYIKSKQLQPAVRALKRGLQYDANNGDARQMLQDLETYLRKTP